MMLRAAHRKWERDGRDEEGRKALLKVSRLYGEARREARTEYWTKFTNRIGNAKNLGEIWHEVRKVQGKVTKPVAHPEPKNFADGLIDRWASESKADLIPGEIKAAVREWEQERRTTINTALKAGSVTDSHITRDELLMASPPHQGRTE